MPRKVRKSKEPTPKRNDARSGRTLYAPSSPRPTPATTVVVVNESFARRYWPDQSPLGKRIKYGAPTTRAGRGWRWSVW